VLAGWIIRRLRILFVIILGDKETINQLRDSTCVCLFYSPRWANKEERITTTPIIKTATESDEEGVIDVVVRAFATDPAARWSWPDSQQFLMHFPSFVRAVRGKAFTKGTAYYVDDGYAAAALWLAPNVHPDEDKLTSLVQSTVSEQIQKDFLSVFEQMGHYHPSEPHWFLPFMGVDPFQQGKGFGSALL
jgi:GNAT superfamily N-acetyltransferase